MRGWSRRRFALGLVAFVALACASAGGDPAEAVERYMRAKVEADAEAIRELLCSAMEAMFEQEANTFRGVSGAQLEGMDCTRSGDSDLVSCTGRITAQYGTEQEEFPLTSYRVVEEDGEWKWCGEAP